MAATIPFLLVDSAGQETAVHRDGGAGDESGGIGGKEDGRAHQLLHLSEALHGSAHQEFLAARGAVQQFLVQGGTEHAGHNGVYAHAVGRPFHRQGAGESEHAAFAGGIGGGLEEAEKRGKGSKVDNAAIAALHHVAAKNFAGVKQALEVDIQNSVPVLVAELQGRQTLGDAGGVDQNVHFAEGAERFLKQLVQGGLVGHVAGNSQGAAA